MPGQKSGTMNTKALRETNESLELMSKRKQKSQQGSIQADTTMSTILNSLSLQIYVTDLESDKIIFINQHVKDRVGDVMGQVYWQALHCSHDRPYADCANLLLKDGKPKGSYLWESETFIPDRCYQFVDQAIRWTDGQMVRLSVGTDITDYKKAERNLETTFKDLKQTHDQLIQSESLVSMGQMVGAITHEVKNPVNFIYSALGPLKTNLISLFMFMDCYLDLEKRNYTDTEDLFHRMKKIKSRINILEVYSDVRDLIEIIAEGTERVITIVQDIQQLSEGNGNVREDIDINQCLDSTLNLLSSQCKESIRVLKHYMDDAVITCNPVQIKQVLLNILTNSIHAMNSKGIIRIETYKDLDDIYITISDNGCGIPEDLVDKIFDPFYTSRKSGTGMGLYIVQEIVKKHQGSLKVFSEVNLGTIFTIRLPAN